MGCSHLGVIVLGARDKMLLGVDAGSRAGPALEPLIRHYGYNSLDEVVHGEVARATEQAVELLRWV